MFLVTLFKYISSLNDSITCLTAYSRLYNLIHAFVMVYFYSELTIHRLLFDLEALAEGTSISSIGKKTYQMTA